MAHVTIAEYDPQWPIRFKKEKLRVLEVIGHKVLGCEHIGSTAVPGLGAKPIIDMMAGVRGQVDADECIPLLEKIGYTSFTRDTENPDRYYCCGKGPHSIGYHLHLMKYKSAEWQRHLLFRDYLRAHLERALQYLELKKELAAKYSLDRGSYTKAKSSFIESVISAARKEIDLG